MFSRWNLVITAFWKNQLDMFLSTMMPVLVPIWNLRDGVRLLRQRTGPSRNRPQLILGLVSSSMPSLITKVWQRKRYRYEDMMTPYDKLKSLADANEYLKPGWDGGESWI